MTLDEANYTLTIETVSADQPYALEVSYTVNHTIPAHIVYINKPSVYYEILASEKVDKILNSWNYILGSWYLGDAPFIQGSTSEVIKVAQTPSIKPFTLNALASDLAALISKARLNGSIVISPVTVTTSTSTVTVEYNVQQSDTNQVNKIELLDSSNHVLTSSGVYVPITQTTVFKHTIPVKEGTNGN